MDAGSATIVASGIEMASKVGTFCIVDLMIVVLVASGAIQNK